MDYIIQQLEKLEFSLHESLRFHYECENKERQHSLFGEVQRENVDIDTINDQINQCEKAIAILKGNQHEEQAKEKTSKAQN